ncbi:MAG TPA: DUF3810 family protein [Vicinamibacterales bacterium]|nr:DUF3810 family protein [Vicinamibacterales bacterium]
MILRVAIVVVALAAALLPLPARAVERWYSSSLYPALQQIVTPVSNLAPVALFDLAGVLLLVLLVAGAVRRVGRAGVLRGALTTVMRLVVVAAAVYLIFLAMWGLNYRRVPLEEKLEFVPAGITMDGALALGKEAVQAVNALQAAGQTRAFEERRLRDALERVSQRLGSGWTAATPVPKRSLLEAYFRRAGIDGMTDPFFLEIILNPDLLPFEKPFVLGHEWAHLAGFADEAEAGYLAWLACLGADDAARYSGWLAVYSSVSGRLPREQRRALAAMLDEGPRSDLEAAAARQRRAVPAVSRIARQTYDVYLRANRVEEGIESYDAVVRLILGTTESGRRTPQLR